MNIENKNITNKNHSFGAVCLNCLSSFIKKSLASLILTTVTPDASFIVIS
jgi:hypothetical protein